MSTRQRSNELGSHDAQQHLRFVEVYQVIEPITLTGTLTTRTSDTEGIITIDEPEEDPELEVGTIVTVTWTVDDEEFERTDVEITDIDLLEYTIEGGEGDDLPAEDTEVTITIQTVFQPVQVKLLRFEGYVAATTGTLTAENTTFTINSTKSGEYHGTFGNDIGIVFEIDSGITQNAEATLAAGTLTIKVKNTSVTWRDIRRAVGAAEGGRQFSLNVAVPTAVFDSADESITGTLTGGVDGDYQTVGAEFGIGDRNTEADVGDQFWIVWKRDANRWEIVGGSGGGAHFQIVRGEAVRATASTEPHFQIEGSPLLALEQRSKVPPAPLWVANPTELATARTLGQLTYAIYRQGADQIEASDQDGTLTTRTDDDTGVVTLDAVDPAHIIRPGYKVRLTWMDGEDELERDDMEVTAVSDDAITLDGGTGEVLPDDETEVTVHVIPESIDWEILNTGGGEATVNLKFCRVTDEITKATGWALDDAGSGEANVLNADGSFSAEQLVITNRYFDRIPINAAIWVLELGEDVFVINSGCALG